MVRICVLLFCTVSIVSLGQELDYGPMRKLPNSISSPYEDILPLQSPDGKTLFFSRAASPENVGGKFAGVDIWISQYDEASKEWGKPQADAWRTRLPVAPNQARDRVRTDSLFLVGFD